MTALALELPRKFAAGVPAHFTTMPVKASEKIWQGSAVEMVENSSIDEAEGLAGASSEFVGFADRTADNSAGAAGAIQCKIRQKGIVLDVTVTSAAATSVHAAVYMADDNVMQIASTLATQIGKVLKYHAASGLCDVYFEGVGVRSI